MDYRKFGRTDLLVSEVGFGAWAIGGPAMAGKIPIGWGDADNQISEQALKTAFDRGINFFDTADFYGLGHSEELIGNVLANQKEVIIATKVGHRLAKDQSIYLDYSGHYIIEACETSLRRLKRGHIDYYQLHAAKLDHLMQGDCIDAMEKLKKEGKIRYWGLSVNTFHPETEGDYLVELKVGDGLQCVLNILNQKSLPLIKRAAEAGYGIIARMPLQFGLLTGKFSRDSSFGPSDHRSFRFSEEILKQSLDHLEKIWPLGSKLGIEKATLALSYIMSYPDVSTVIPGIRNPEQAEQNAQPLVRLQAEDMELIERNFDDNFRDVVDLMEAQG